MKEIQAGTVTLVGGGPGDPDLLTVGGLRALRQADVVVHDRLAPLASLAECRPEAEIIAVGKVPRGQQTSQEEINALLIDRARAGKRVVRFKGGDSFVLGRGGEEWQACAEAGIEVAVIPGVTSAVAVPALAGVPVTHRSLAQGYTVVSGHVPPHDPRSKVNWTDIARSGTTVVVLMGVHNSHAITAELLAAGMACNTPAAVVQDAYRPGTNIQFTTLAALAEVAKAVSPPAIMVVGAVAGLRLHNVGPQAVSCPPAHN